MITISKDDKKLLKMFVDNKPLMEAVKRVMTAKIYEHGGVKNSTTNFIFQMPLNIDDAEYGRKTKIMVQALIEVENAYQAMVLGTAETPKKPKEEENR